MCGKRGQPLSVRQGMGQQHALKLASGQIVHLHVADILGAGLRQSRIRHRPRDPSGQAEEPAHRHRQRWFNVQALGHIS